MTPVDRLFQIYQFQHVPPDTLPVTSNYYHDTLANNWFQWPLTYCALGHYENRPQHWLWTVIPASASMVTPKEHDLLPKWWQCDNCIMHKFVL